MKKTGEKDFKKFYGELRGGVLFFFEDVTQHTYTERLDLDQLKSIKLDSLHKTSPAIFTLTITGSKDIKLKIDNADTGEEWRGCILTVVKKEIPSTLQLLPGQMLLLKDVLAQEKRRTAALGSNPPLPPRPAFLSSSSPPTASFSIPEKNLDNSSQAMPSCFFSVSRKEAEQMLENNPEFGSIILRPSSKTNSYGLTMRHLGSSGPVMKNYMVTETPDSRFIIELDSPVKVPTLNAVINYVLEKTEYRLHPFCPSGPYDTTIEKPLIPPSPTSKTKPKAKVPPMVHTKDVPVPTPVPSDNEYLVPEDEPTHTRSGQFDGELRKILLKRREGVYRSADDDAAYEMNP
uniref:Signal-transducing adaptor protein 1 n=1 Tax=Knipowitschia caucasica TaxID=637954 RepID=A0AAV2MJQ0_KNICA